MSDEDMLRIQNRQLERENRQLRRNLRDEFAMAALPEIIGQTQLVDVGLAPGQAMQATAIIAYRMADAMLEARK